MYDHIIMGKLFEANFGAKICVFVLDHVAGERNQLIMAINQSTGCIPRPAAAPPVSADSLAHILLKTI